jgi:hypothetical protein
MGRLPKSIVSLAAVRRASDILAPRLNPGQGGLADMGALEVAGVREIHHYTPLHYLPFIARAGALLGKPTMRSRGFQDSHFRSMSSRHDVARGFGEYAFLTLHPAPPILKAKLAAGFPHVRITVDATSVDAVAYDLCRFNVAMTRQLRRGGKAGFAESATNGRYYGKAEIPVARTTRDQAAMLKEYAGTDSMIEVLVPGQLTLPQETAVYCFSAQDRDLAAQIVAQCGVEWAVIGVDPPGHYPRSQRHSRAVEEFVAQTLGDPLWRGNELEFDRL